MQTIIIGHKNPDMDSICAAIGYAELKRLQGWQDVVAGRAGATNPRIDFVLNRYGMESPQLFTDLSPRVQDVMQSNVVSVHADTPIYDAVQLIDRRRLRGLPVVDDKHRCLGLLSAFKITHHLFPPREEVGATRTVVASLADISRTIGGQLVCGELKSDPQEYFLMAGATRQDSFGQRITKYQADGKNVVVFVGDRTQIQRIAIEHRVGAIVVTGGAVIEPDIEIAARTNGVTLMTAPADTATTVLLTRGAAHARQMLETDFLAFQGEARLSEARQKAADSSAFVFPVLDEHGVLCGILSKSDFIKKIPRQLILVDHNELDQAVRGADQLPIIEILDHHRLGGFTSATPLLFWNNPVGSTSTIVSQAYLQANIPIPKAVAGVLMAGLISDTLNLNSPTTTETDTLILRHLEKIAGVDATAFAGELFSVGSPLLTLSAEDAINADSKPYTENDHRFVVAQIEELTFAHLEKKRDALLQALEAQRKKESQLFSALLVTDITTHSSLLLVCGDERFLDQIDYPVVQPRSIWQLDGVVSRKKQLLPYLIECLAKMPER